MDFYAALFVVVELEWGELDNALGVGGGHWVVEAFILSGAGHLFLILSVEVFFQDVSWLDDYKYIVL